MSFRNNSEQARMLWVEALRSGEYEQIDGQLRETNLSGHPVGYCCLGVACELFLKHEPQEEGHWSDPYFVTEHGNSDTGLPVDVANWLGIGMEGRLVEYLPFTRESGEEDFAHNVIDLNDNAKYNFNQIADVIEQGKLLCA